MLCSLLVAAACTKEASMENKTPVAENSSIKFEITVDPFSKAVKSDWEDGDAVFVFFKGSTQTYLKLTRTSGKWEYSVNGPESDITDAASKQLTAVFLPFASGLTPSYDNGWKFNAGMSYFMVHENVSYTTGIGDNGETVVMARVTLRNNVEKSVQFYVEDPDAGTTTTDGSSCAYSLTNETVKPFGFGSVNADGTVSAVEGDCDQPMPGYVYNNGTETGYLFSGLVGNSDAEEGIKAKRMISYDNSGEEPDAEWGNSGYSYVFVLSDGEHTYAKFNALSNVIAPYSALKLGNLKATNPQKWWEVGEGHGVPFGSRNTVFSTVTYGAEFPWEIGSYFNYEEAQALNVPGWRLPANGVGGFDYYNCEFQDIIDFNTLNYYDTKVKGKKCYIVADKQSPKFLIICDGGYSFWRSGSLVTREPGWGIRFWTVAGDGGYYCLDSSGPYVYEMSNEANLFQVRLVKNN